MNSKKYISYIPFLRKHRRNAPSKSSAHAQSCPAVWTIAHQAPLSMGFTRQGYWSGLPFPSPGDLPNPGIEPASSAWAGTSLPLSHQGSSIIIEEVDMRFRKAGIQQRRGKAQEDTKGELQDPSWAAGLQSSKFQLGQENRRNPEGMPSGIKHW